MSYVVENAGDRYRGGYASSSNKGVPDALRVATSTFENYIGGTVIIVFSIFAVLLALSVLVFMLMCYARYLKMRRHKGGFYNPPPIVSRHPKRSDTYSTIAMRSNEYASLQRKNAPSQLSHAQSQQSEML